MIEYKEKYSYFDEDDRLVTVWEEVKDESKQKN